MLKKILEKFYGKSEYLYLNKYTMDKFRFKQLLESTLGNVKPLITEGDNDTPKKWKEWAQEGYEYSPGTYPPNKNDMFYGQLSVLTRIKQAGSEHLRQTIFLNAKEKGFNPNVDGLIVFKNLDDGKIECRFLTKEKLF
jgi:hypothetical protein